MFNQLIAPSRSRIIYDSWIETYGIAVTLVKIIGFTEDFYGQDEGTGTETIIPTKIITQQIDPLTDFGDILYDEDALPIMAFTRQADNFAFKDIVRFNMPITIDENDYTELEVIQVDSIQYYMKRVKLAPKR